MADTAPKQPMNAEPSKLSRIGLGRRVGRTVGLAFEGDGRDGNVRHHGKPAFVGIILPPPRPTRAASDNCGS